MWELPQTWLQRSLLAAGPPAGPGDRGEAPEAHRMCLLNSPTCRHPSVPQFGKWTQKSESMTPEPRISGRARRTVGLGEGVEGR